MNKTLSLLMALALTMAAGLAWSQAETKQNAEATMTCGQAAGKAACAMAAEKAACKAEGPCKAECAKAAGKCAMADEKGACKAECPCKAECAKAAAKCALGEGKGAKAAEAGMKANGKAGCCAAKQAACTKAAATEKAE